MDPLARWQDAVSDELARRRSSITELANRSGLSYSSLRAAMAGDRPISVDRLSRALGALEWDLYDLAQAVDRAGGREPADVLRPGKDKKIEPVPESEREDRLRSLFELLGGDDFELVIRRREDQP